MTDAGVWRSRLAAELSVCLVGVVAGCFGLAVRAKAQQMTQYPPSQDQQIGAPLGQSSPIQAPQIQNPQTPDSFGGSIEGEKAIPGVRPLSLDDAIQMGLRYNLGAVLAGQNSQTAAAQRLQVLQSLLPVVGGYAREAVQQVDLQAEGLRVPGFPVILGPFGYTDIRATAQWSMLNISSLQSYMAAKQNFAGSGFSQQDARDMVVLSVGNAYLLCIADAARMQAAQSEVDTSKISLDQAKDSHDAGTSPLLDVLRAQVDYQSEEQTLIAATNQYQKDKIALARAIGLPLEQEFELTDQVPFAALTTLNPDAAVQQALAMRSDLRSLERQVQAAQDAQKGAKAERYPTVAASADYGVIGPTLGHSHGTFDATGTASVPLFDEAQLRGDARAAQADLEQKQSQLSNLRGQIGADVRDTILDIQAADQQVQVARNNDGLAKEALREAQLRYSSGVSDNLAVSQAQAAVAQADEQYIHSLYQSNVAKLSLARALGIAQSNYKDYLGGK